MQGTTIVWAARGTRGHTQLSGDLISLFDSDFAEDVDVDAAQTFLQELIALKPQAEGSAP